MNPDHKSGSCDCLCCVLSFCGGFLNKDMVTNPISSNLRKCKKSPAFLETKIPILVPHLDSGQLVDPDEYQSVSLSVHKVS